MFWVNIKIQKNVIFKKAPMLEVVSVTFKENYKQVVDVNRAAIQWIKDNGYRLGKMMFSIYHVNVDSE
ncbi:hypothetical protein [Clostridium formicaceticum]|uniref:Uncharacterized protein n=1 Tax=Clostridium formicaceticum TaxID=1497 RepID=A0AAC9RQ63_9CLOT|nr:hypothetical protein [Clostridium formicaceticum]AOY77707.1 hypothetical protein BJL90_18685 [Clostridium formicaceticum]ARE88295.1 hypothetical protein CLFO_26960 [Clostridium formicaceticum]